MPDVFDFKSPAEAVFYGWDASRYLNTAGGETIQTAVFACRVYDGGTDAGAAAMVSGAAVINGTKFSQKIINGVTGVRYLITGTINTSSGQTFQESGLLSVVSKT